MNKSRVSAPQFFSLLYLSVLSSIFMYISSPEISISRTDSLLRPLVFIVVSIVAAIPVCVLHKMVDKEKKMGKKAVIKDNVFFKIISLMYAIVWVTGILRTLARFDLFASSELFPGNDMTLFIMALVTVCGLLSLLGLGALSRAAIIFTVIVVGVTGFVMISLWGDVDFLNFTPLFENGVGSFIRDSLLFCVQAFEIGTLILFLPGIKGKVIKSFIFWAVLSGVTFSVILFFTVGTLGVFADTQLFPTYTAVTLAKFGLLERMDALETAIWILCVVEKISLYFLAVINCIKTVFPKVSKKGTCVILILVVSIVLGIISGDLEKFGFVSYSPLTIGLYAVAVIVLPVVLIIYFKKVKPYEENFENN